MYTEAIEFGTKDATTVQEVSDVRQEQISTLWVSCVSLDVLRWQRTWRKDYVCHTNQRCFMSADANNAMNTQEIQELACNHEEADDRLLLHAKHASTQGDSSVVIRSTDTDVFLLCIGNVHELTCPLYFATGTVNNARLIHADAVTEQIGLRTAQAIIGLHAFTGCDSTKSSCSKTNVSKHVFCSLEREWDVTSQQLRVLEEFVCGYMAKRPAL